MSFKSFVNSHTGRKVLMLIALMGLAFAFCFYILYTLVGGAIANKDTLAGSLKEKMNTFSITETSITPEENSLAGLPSETFSFVDYEGAGSPSLSSNHPLSAAFNEIQKHEQTSILNFHASFTSTENNKDNTSYNFMFYGESLRDYNAQGLFQNEAEFFSTLFQPGITDVNFESKPIIGGGREYEIVLTAEKKFDFESQQYASDLWQRTLDHVGNSLALGENAIVELTLKDQGRVSVTTVLASNEDIANAKELDRFRWESLAFYAYDSRVDYLQVISANYAIERTPEDSVLTVVTGDAIKDSKNLRERILKTARDSQEDYSVGDLFVVWSYNTYLVTEDDPNPYLMFGSSSRNW